MELWTDLPKATQIAGAELSYKPDPLSVRPMLGSGNEMMSGTDMLLPSGSF